MKIHSVLQRIGESDIQKYFLSKESIQIFSWIRGEEFLSSIDVRKHIGSHLPHADMLRNNKIRALLLDSLDESHAIDLFQKITGRKPKSSIYEELSTISFRKNNKAEKILFEFFEEEIPAEDDKVIAYADIEIVKPARKLFSHQRNAFDEVLSHLDQNKRRCILHMPTGSGKTITAIRIASTFFLKSKPTMVIWLAYNEDLCEQAIDEFKQTWGSIGDRDITIYRFFGKHSPDLIEKTKNHKECLIVAGLKKAHEADTRFDVFLSKLADRVNLVIMDEAHQAMAPTFFAVLQQLTEKRPGKTSLLGLSATPGRTSQSERQQLSAFFSNNKVSLQVEGYENPVQYLIDKGYLAKPNSLLIRADARLTKMDLDKIKKNPIDIPESILDKMGHDSRRTLKIIGQIQDLVERGHKRIIMFGTTIKNSQDISILLTMLGYKSFHIDATTISATKKQYVDEYKDDTNETIIMCNVGVFTTGFDAPKTSAVVIARPVQSFILFSQMAGRAMRGIKVGGNKKCEIRTITDIRLPQFTELVEIFFEWEDAW